MGFNCLFRRSRRVRLWSLGLSMLCAGFSGWAQAPQGGLTLDEAVRLAASQSRRVAATQAQAQAVQQMAVAAGERPDPVLRLSLTNVPADGPDRWSLTRDFMTMRSIGVMQELTRADKRQARAARALREADGVAAAERQLVSELQRDAALAWLERSFQQAMRELLVTQAGEAQLQVQAAQALYRAGKGAQADVFAARGQVEQLGDRIAQVDRMVAVATTQLQRWIGDAASQALAARPDFVAPAWTQGDWSQHLAAHPVIELASQQEALARAEAEVARANQRSDWSVELMYSQRGPSYSNMVSLNFSVPLQSNPAQRQDRELSARQAQVARAAAEREDLQRAHEAEVRAALQEWRSHDERLRRYDSALLPLAQQRSAAALGSYRAGSTGLAMVLDARAGEIDARMERLRIEMQIARLWAQLFYLVTPTPSGAAPAAPAHRSQP